MNVHSVSLIGKRESNEDQHQVILNGDRSKKNMTNINFFSIFDGHGGNKVSKFLKENLHPYFLRKETEYPVDKTYINTVYNHLQKTLSIKHKEMATHCGSTALTIIHFKKNNNFYLQVFNVGDCRAVLCRNNMAWPLTKDHKPGHYEERARIEKIDKNQIYYDGDDWRVKDLSVSRAFGDIDAMPYVTHTPETFKYKLEKNDKFLVMACDGLWDVLSSDDAINFVLGNIKEEGNAIFGQDKRKNIAKSLADHAIKMGSTDNITVIITFFK
jgi:protein phosphatase 2C family protein 2/3